MWTAYLLRSAAVVLLLLAFAGLQMVLERDALTVLFALDCSKSVPEKNGSARSIHAEDAAREKSNDEAGLIVFGGKAAARNSAQSADYARRDSKHIHAQFEPDATNIQDAFACASHTFDENSGRPPGPLHRRPADRAGDAAEELKRLVSMGVDAWIVPLKTGDTAEMLVDKVILPNELMWEQPYECHVFIKSNITARAKVRLYPGDKAGVASLEQTVDLVPGKNRVTFSKDDQGQPLRMHSGGAKEVKAVLEPLRREDDTLSENNEAYAFTDVQTDSRVLVLTSDVSEVKYLLSTLEDEKMTLDVRSGATLPENPEEYRAYDCIVLANLARGFLSEQQMSVMQSCVEDQGAGLVMIGGEESFGAGGYLHTPIEDALPVNMDLENKKIMPSGALCLVLHTCEFGEGNAWGKKISKAAINVLAPQDYAGLLIYGNMGGEQFVFPETLVAQKQRMFGLIDGCEPGDMPDLDRIVNMAVSGLVAVPNVNLKHCIVITDGDPSPPRPETIAAAKTGAVAVDHHDLDFSARRRGHSRVAGFGHANRRTLLPGQRREEAAADFHQGSRGRAQKFDLSRRSRPARADCARRPRPDAERIRRALPARDRVGDDAGQTARRIAALHAGGRRKSPGPDELELRPRQIHRVHHRLHQPLGAGMGALAQLPQILGQSLHLGQPPAHAAESRRLDAPRRRYRACRGRRLGFERRIHQFRQARW